MNKQLKMKSNYFKLIYFLLVRLKYFIEFQLKPIVLNLVLYVLKLNIYSFLL